MKLKNPILLPVIERLERNLEDLSFYCAPPGVGTRVKGTAASRLVAWMMLRGIYGPDELGFWPSHDALREIQADVIFLAERGRVRQIFPEWKAFEQVDRRWTKLRLKLRVGNLISRARAMLPGESELSKVVRLTIAGNTKARCLLGDMIMNTEKLAELLKAERQMERKRCMAQPLARWTVSIEHPMAKDFVYIAGFEPIDIDLHRRFLQWDRVRCHRLNKKISLKSVAPV